MNKLNRSIPLAFLLAVAADASSLPFGESTDAPPVLTHGMLAALLADDAKSTVAEPHGKPPAGQEVAQFFRNFGFLNCFGGAWRNC